MRHLGSCDRGAGILEAQAASGFFAGAVGDVFVAFFEMWRTPVEVVGVGGQEVNPIAVEQFVGEGFCVIAEAAIERGGCHLHDASDANPFGKHFGAPDNDWIAFGVGDDVGVSSRLQPVQSVAQLRRNGHLGKFNQQVAFAANRVLEGIVKGVVDIVGVEMKIARQAQLDAALKPRLDLGQALGVQLGLIEVGVVGVGRTGYVSDTFGDGYFCHGERGLKIGGAVVYSIDKVMMNVDHWGRAFIFFCLNRSI
jgi:hypothetical protein